MKGFVPEKGNFKTYAIWRIRGSMRDFIREMDWVPRLVRSRKEKVKQLGSLNYLLQDDREVQETLVDRSADSPSNPMQRNDLFNMISRSLLKTDKMILRSYFLEHLTMKTIAKNLGISESRGSQRMDNLLKDLRERFADRKDEFDLLDAG